TLDILDPSSVTVYPNPVSDQLQIDLTATDIRGDIKLFVFDVNGKLVMSQSANTNGYVQMGVSSLQNGYYTLHISNDKYIIGKKFVVVK
ncbi:MAG TPA: T9SS type A sorting domain-containing protein, partial [Saprospiraceae bacterium]|nr:T9SS type A sorting domain-containing protein [Saprospiraceae bacterium]